jgi:hypothetical protein
MRLTRRELGRAFLVAGSCAACGRRSPQGLPSMTVELDVYSGRPNPTWSLSAAEAEQIAGLLKDLPRTAAGAAEGLGYRGFVLRMSDPAGATSKSVRVSTGVVTIQQGDRAEHFVDAHGVEERLLQQARDHGFGSVVDALRPK